jgi:DNA polymerase-4
MRKIIHVDMDAFFAAIEQRDFPELKGKPVIVGSDPHERGVVATCSYEARKYGVHSAMPSSVAYRLCPEGVFVRPRFEVYSKVAKQIRAIFFEYTDLVEPLSLDEAYLDVTQNKKNEPSATKLAKEIKKRIFQTTALTASAGVSFNKFLAKLASDFNKPDGLTVVVPKYAVAFIEMLPIRKFPGVGKVTEQRMKRLGIHTGKELRQCDKEMLMEEFGKIGAFFYDIAHCKDDRAVNPKRERKSLGREHTFQTDLQHVEQIEQHLDAIAKEVEELLKYKNVTGLTLTLKVRYFDFETITRAKTVKEPFRTKEQMAQVAKELLKKTHAQKKPIRLLGISISHFNTSYLRERLK